VKKILAFVIAGLVFGIGSLFADSSEVGKYEQGGNLYNNKCQLCHGIKGDGNGPAAAVFSPRPTDFTSPKFWQNAVDKKITDAIKNGKNPMPAFDLTADEIKAIIDYISHAFKPGG